MRAFAAIASIVGVILLAVGLIRYFAIAHIMSGGNISLFTIGSIALVVGLICAAASTATHRRVDSYRNHP